MKHTDCASALETRSTGGSNWLKKPSPAEIINLRERNFNMLKKDLIMRNPLRLLGQENQDIIPEGGIGAVLARAGVGKTAMMVQLALDTLLREKKVLHVSLDDPVEKVSLWHKEVFHNLAEQYNLSQINQLWESILPSRFIMTFKVEGFSVPKLEERLADLTEQNIFNPHMIVIDGFPFDGTVTEPLKQLQSFTRRQGLRIWLSVRTHRHEDPGPDGIPPQLQNIDDLFDVILQLQPEGKNININALKGVTSTKEYPELQLDPATMLICPNTK